MRWQARHLVWGVWEIPSEEQFRFVFFWKRWNYEHKSCPLIYVKQQRQIYHGLRSADADFCSCTGLQSQWHRTGWGNVKPYSLIFTLTHACHGHRSFQTRHPYIHINKHCACVTGRPVQCLTGGKMLSCSSPIATVWLFPHLLLSMGTFCGAIVSRAPGKITF